MTNKYTKRCTNSLVTWEMRIKTIHHKRALTLCGIQLIEIHLQDQMLGLYQHKLLYISGGYAS